MSNQYKGIIVTSARMPDLVFEFEADDDSNAMMRAVDVATEFAGVSWFMRLRLSSTSVKGEPGVVTFDYDRLVDDIYLSVTAAGILAYKKEQGIG